MGGHSARRSTKGALPGAGLPERGVMVHIKFPAASKIEHQISKRVILGKISAEKGEEIVAKARAIIRRSQSQIYQAVDEAGGVRARREEGQVVGSVPMGTFALPRESAGVAQVIWSQAALAQRQLAALGIGGIQYTAPAHYTSAAGDGHVARVLDERDSVVIGRRGGLWRKNLAMMSIDLPAAHPRRRSFYRAYDQLTSSTGTVVRRIGYSTYVGHPADIHRLEQVASQLGIDYRA